MQGQPHSRGVWWRWAEWRAILGLTIHCLLYGSPVSPPACGKIFIHEKLRTFLNQKIHIRAGLYVQGQTECYRAASFIIPGRTRSEPWAPLLCSVLRLGYPRAGQTCPLQRFHSAHHWAGLSHLGQIANLSLDQTVSSPQPSLHHNIPPINHTVNIPPSNTRPEMKVFSIFTLWSTASSSRFQIMKNEKLFLRED